MGADTATSSNGTAGWHDAQVNQGALERARAGDERAFVELVGPHRAELRLHCYRMLGSLTDAEELLQETLLAAWQGMPGFGGRSSLRTWLYRVATNRCLNAIRDRRRRVPPAEPVPPFVVPTPSRRGEVTWLQPYPDALLEQIADPAPGPAGRERARAGVELAFIAALQRLPPRQTAALVLCDALDFSVAEAAPLLDSGETAVKGLLQRARATVARNGGPATDAGATAARSPQEQELARRFARAYEADDIDAVIELLTDEAWLAMPPAPHEYHGRAAIARFLHASAAGREPRSLRLVATRANTQPAFYCRVREPGASTDASAGILVLSLTGGQLTGITRFLDPRLQPVFAQTEARDLHGQPPG